MVSQIRIIVCFFILFVSCNENDSEILIYQGQYFEKNQDLVLDIDNGKFVYKKEFNSDYIVDRPKLIKKYRTDESNFSVHLTIENKDTTLVFPSSTKKILFGEDSDGDLFIYTENDSDVWLID